MMRGVVSSWFWGAFLAKEEDDMISKLRFAALSASAIAVIGCAEPQEDDVTVESNAIINGAAATALDATVAVYTGRVRPCSGVLVRFSWVLTTTDCVAADPALWYTGNLLSPSQVKVGHTLSPGLQPPPTQPHVTSMYAWGAGDLAMIRLTYLIPNTVPLWNGRPTDANNALVHGEGYGRLANNLPDNVEDGTSGAGTLRTADFRVTTPDDWGYSVTPTVGGRAIGLGDEGGPSFRSADALGRAVTGVMGVHLATSVSSQRDMGVHVSRGWILRTAFVSGGVMSSTADPGTINGSFHRGSDIVLTGGSGWTTIPIASPVRATPGTFTVTAEPLLPGSADFISLSRVSGAKTVLGDFNGDGVSDLALVSGSGWSTIPVAFSHGDGVFEGANISVPNFPAWSRVAGAKAVVGDFNGDGRSDIALTGPAGWSTIPVAFATLDGKFNVTNMSVSNFPIWASQSGAKPVAGDFDGDGRDDIALTGGIGWGSIPVAFSNADGTFFVTNVGEGFFSLVAQQQGAKPISGDFNGDGRTDIALTGGVNWGSIPVAFSNGNGSFNVTNQGVTDFPIFAQMAGATPVTGDYNFDGKDDIALTSGVGWGSLPVAFSGGTGGFDVTNGPAGNFPTLAQQSGARPTSGH
jgi:hypothetical protein